MGYEDSVRYGRCAQIWGSVNYAYEIIDGAMEETLIKLDDSNGRVQRSQTVPIHHVYDPCRGPVIDALDCAT